jgi:hypothetical protein
VLIWNLWFLQESASSKKAKTADVEEGEGSDKSKSEVEDDGSDEVCETTSLVDVLSANQSYLLVLLIITII